MKKDGTARARRSPMTVRELMARLQDKDPDFLVIIDAPSQSLMIVNPKPGFCSPEEIQEEQEHWESEQDRQFLRDLHIKE